MSLYRTLLRERFAALSAELQRFHSSEGAAKFSGCVQVEGARTCIGALISRIIGLPAACAQSPLAFELRAEAAHERWTRCFPDRRMSSTLRSRDGRLVESLGPLTLHFELVVADNRLVMQVVELKVFGVVLPRSFARGIRAEETGCEGRLHFEVRASLPWLGHIVSYSGYLELACQSAGR